MGCPTDHGFVKKAMLPVISMIIHEKGKPPSGERIPRKRAETIVGVEICVNDERKVLLSDKLEDAKKIRICE